MGSTLATVLTTILKNMARRSSKNGIQDEGSSKSLEGVNILTDTSIGVYVEGAEETIDMYEKGEISREDLYNAILDLDVVYRSVESKKEE